MKNHKFRKWIILIVVLAIAIIAAVFAVKGYKKDKPVNSKDVIVKENVHVIDDKHAPDKITENTLVYDGKKPKYKKGDVLVAGIIDEAEDGFIRRVTNVEKKNGEYIFETETALLTDVFEKAHIVKKFQVTEDGLVEVEDTGMDEAKIDDIIAEQAVMQTDQSYSAMPLSSTKPVENGSGINITKKETGNDLSISGFENVKKYDIVSATFEFSAECKSEDGKIKATSNTKFRLGLELVIDIDHDDLKLGITFDTNANADITAEYADSVKKDFEKRIFSKKLPNYQFLAAGFVPVVVTNDIEAIFKAEANLDGNIKTTYTPSVESSLGLVYDSKKGTIEPVNEFKKDIDGLQWNTEGNVTGKAYADLCFHYITKLYGVAGIDLSAGIYGSADGEAHMKINGAGENEMSGKLDLEIGPEIKGNLTIDLPIIKQIDDTEVFKVPLSPFWSRHWENEIDLSDVGNLGTTYKTRFAEANTLDAPVFQFDVPFGWSVTTEQVGKPGDQIQEQVVISNKRGVTVTYWDHPQSLGGQSGVVMEKANISKAADSDFVTKVRDPESEEDLANTQNFMVARVHVIGTVDMKSDSGEVTPADGTFFALLPTSKLGETYYTGQAGEVDEFSFSYYGQYAFIAEAPDGTFSDREEKDVIQILKSFNGF